MYHYRNSFISKMVCCTLSKYYVTVPGPEPSDDKIKLLSLVKSQEGGFATAPEIEPQTEVGSKQTRNRLDSLVDDGLLKSRKVGSTNVYWLTDEGEAELAQSLV